jgi:Trp operon repressor
MDIQQLLKQYLEYQKDEVNKILLDISLPKEEKNALIKRIVDIKEIIQDTQAKIKTIQELTYAPHCS